MLDIEENKIANLNTTIKLQPTLSLYERNDEHLRVMLIEGAKTDVARVCWYRYPVSLFQRCRYLEMALHRINYISARMENLPNKIK